MHFSLYYQPDIAPDYLYLRAEVISIEEDDDPQIIQALLTENLCRYHLHAPVFALCPDMVQVIALKNLALDKTNERQLEKIVQELTTDIKQWRERLLETQLKTAHAPTPSALPRSHDWDSRFNNPFLHKGR